VRGKYVEFDVNASTFATTNYTLTGAANPTDLTGGQRTPVFASKVPDLQGKTLDAGELEITFSPQTVQLRRGGQRREDEDPRPRTARTGGTFQMEPEAGQALTVTHTLAPGDLLLQEPVYREDQLWERLDADRQG
jgi:hypothetical protein